MHTLSAVRRGVAAAVVALLAIVAFPPGAGADEIEQTDPVGDVPYQRGDITRIRVIHRSGNVDLRVRTRLGGQPLNNWPNRATYIRWRIDIGGPAGPDYYADLRLLSGVDTLFTGRLRSAHTGQIIPGCGANQSDPNGQTIVTANGNEYRYQFLRGCISAPEQFRARAALVWDNGLPNVGPVYTDYAPNVGQLPPVATG